MHKRGIKRATVYGVGISLFALAACSGDEPDKGHTSDSSPSTAESANDGSVGKASAADAANSAGAGSNRAKRDGGATGADGGTQSSPNAGPSSIGKPSTSNGGSSMASDGGGSAGDAGTFVPPVTTGTNGGMAGLGTCTPSKAASSNASGSGPHKVTVETNSEPGIAAGTIFRPADLGGAEKYPIFAWGEGGCSQNGLSNAAAMGEIASHGYFVIADGTPNGTGSRSMGSTASMGKPLLDYITWAIAENDKPCSAYYHSLDTTKIATNGFSCGGLMAEATAGDPRITTWGLNSSGLFSADQTLYKSIHTPVLIVLGGSGDIAYTNGQRDYDNISALGMPIMLFSKALGHGGDLSKANGDFAKIDLAWLNWWLKGDEGATGKGVLVGPGCAYCSDSAWEVKSKSIP